MVSWVLQLRTASAWTSFALGVPMNACLCWLVWFHTPVEMRVYSKILLQTGFTDILLLVCTLLVDQAVVIVDGGIAVWSNGLLKTSRPEDAGWGLLCSCFWIFLLFVSLFGFMAQFSYRYLTLNRNWTISTGKYFFLFLLALLIPFVYVIIVAISYYPPVEHRVLRDPTLTALLGLTNASEVVVFNGWSPAGNPMMTYAIASIFAAATADAL